MRRMRWDVAVPWMLCCLELLVTGSQGDASTNPTPVHSTHAHTHAPTHNPHQAAQPSRLPRSSDGYRGGGEGVVGGLLGSEGVGALALRAGRRVGSSSSPVEPIKPLLDLGSDGDADGLPKHPIFDEAAPRNVTGLKGTAAYLHCLVHHLGNKSVSWIRRRDLHILTVGLYTYTTDQRYEVIHAEGSKDWILKIKYAQVRDSGNYECQVSTKPVMAYVIKLNVFAAPKAEIIGSPDLHVDRGSTINLTCIIAHSSEPPKLITWFHNTKELSYDSPRGGITIVTERGNATTGYLLIQDARPSDTGNYSCVPSESASATVRVHVLNGETPAAMQTNAGPSSHLPWPLSLLAALAILLCRPHAHSHT